jgi:hypothetical protein
MCTFLYIYSSELKKKSGMTEQTWKFHKIFLHYE